MGVAAVLEANDVAGTSASMDRKLLAWFIVVCGRRASRASLRVPPLLRAGCTAV